jgi:hypothetical protein
MGIVEINNSSHTITITSHMVTYCTEANEILTERIRLEIETMWNAPGAQLFLHNQYYNTQLPHYR